MMHENRAMSWWNIRVFCVWAGAIAGGVGAIGYLASTGFAVVCGLIAGGFWCLSRFCANRFADSYERAQTVNFVANRLNRPANTSTTRSMGRAVDRRAGR